ncbi:DUF3224 domain-containing protein [Streptomyces sp. RG80]|uniref:DUF3224 domain-containing protein n=1 Tax=Streptomyces sp. RG80 TaxID=3157340 RepID=UPI00338DEA14
MPVGVATRDRQYEGEVAGGSATSFTAAYDQSTGADTFVAMESLSVPRSTVRQAGSAWIMSTTSVWRRCCPRTSPSTVVRGCGSGRTRRRFRYPKASRRGHMTPGRPLNGGRA